MTSVVFCRQPSVLTYSTQFMQERVDFLHASGMQMEHIAKAVVSHPQVSTSVCCGSMPLVSFGHMSALQPCRDARCLQSGHSAR